MGVKGEGEGEGEGKIIRKMMYLKHSKCPVSAAKNVVSKSHLQSFSCAYLVENYIRKNDGISGDE